jgi:hypothetical protein
MLISPEPLDYVSYPYEWSFSQLKDAALLILEVQRRALAYGMSLREASGFHVQFRGSRPVFTDALLLERTGGRGWVAHEQFCRHFLAPLLLMAYVSPHFNQYLRTYLDGIPPKFAARALGWRTLFRCGPLAHVRLRAWSLGAKGALVDSLRRCIEKIPAPQRAPASRDASADPLDAEYFKRAFVRRLMRELHPKLVYDVGGNQGAYGRVAIAEGGSCIMYDADPVAVELAYRREKQTGAGHVLPLFMDFGASTLSLERPKADVVMALAPLRHLKLDAHAPWSRIAEFISRLGRAALVEVADEDSSDAFLRAFAAYFRLRERVRVPRTNSQLCFFATSPD